jgi:hypothetical protein
MYRYFTPVQSSQFVLIIVDKDDVMTQVGEACSRDQTDVSRPHDRYLHGALLVSARLLSASPKSKKHRCLQVAKELL